MPDHLAPLRREAAILIADVVNYSRLMQNDELETLNRLKDLRAVIIDPLIHQSDGRIVKLMGDGLLTEFPDNVAAVGCALAMQQQIADQQKDLATEQQMLLRIGINSGEILVEADDIYGHGVNIASRLEELSPVGGICLSENVYDAIGDKMQARFDSAGAYQVKNIEQPIPIFTWQPESLAALYPRQQPSAGNKPKLVLTEFSHRGSHSDIEVFTQSVYETTLSCLANFTGLVLVEDEIAAGYQASGRVQIQGQRYRVTIHLIESRTGQQFWSERFDGELVDIFDTQDILAYSISNALRFTIYKRESERTDDLPMQELSTEELISRAGFLLFSCEDSCFRQATALLQTALARDDQNFMAHALLANSYIREAGCGFRVVDPSEGEAAVAAVQRAIAINPNSDYAHHAAALVEFFYHGNLDAAARSWHRSLEVNSFYAIAKGWLAGNQILQGEVEQGLNTLEEINVSQVLLPLNFIMNWFSGLGYVHKKDYVTALDYFHRADQQARNITFILLALCATASLAGESELAEKTAAQIMKKHPDFQISAMWRWPFRDVQVWPHLEQGLQAAGLPG